MTRAIPAYSVATRVTGGVLALGLLAGVVHGPVVSLVGALALITFGRALAMGRDEAAVTCAALALVGAALGIGALNLGTLDLTEIRGVQGVLGPTLLLGPDAAAVASWAATVAGTVALGVWLAPPLPLSGAGIVIWVAEALLGAATIVSIFWGPKIVAGAGTISTWLVVTAAVVIPAGAFALTLRRLRLVWRTAALLVVTVAVAGAAASLASGL